MLAWLEIWQYDVVTRGKCVLWGILLQFDRGRWIWLKAKSSSPFMNVAKRELAYRKNQSYNRRKRRDIVSKCAYWQPKNREGREEEKNSVLYDAGEAGAIPITYYLVSYIGNPSKWEERRRGSRFNQKKKEIDSVLRFIIYLRWEHFMAAVSSAADASVPDIPCTARPVTNSDNLCQHEP